MGEFRLEKELPKIRVRLHNQITFLGQEWVDLQRRLLVLSGYGLVPTYQDLRIIPDQLIKLIMDQTDRHFDSDSDIDPEELKLLYSQIMTRNKGRKSPPRRERSRSRDLNRRGAKRVSQQDNEERGDENAFKLFQYQMTSINLKMVPEKIKGLPVFKKSTQILETILNNQIVLITGETGCGKSTQVPRILYQYLQASNSDKKILCVQPRRLAAINLERILSKQIQNSGVVSYHIAMENSIKPSTKILFMTNGIFLQRFIHDHEELLSQFPFIILDEVHQRDIDTDFILLSMKHVVRKNPRLRVVLMSATVDNGLFQYYFADDHITKFMDQQNIYLKCLKMESKAKKQKKDDLSDSEDSEKNRIQEAIAMNFMNSKKPCPSIAITQQGAFTKQYYYLQTIDQFFKRHIQIQWANTSFNEKFPILMKEMLVLGVQLVEQIFEQSKKNQNFSILVFLPGLIEIQMFCSHVAQYCSKDLVFDIIQLHSTTLNSQISAQLNDSNPPRPRLIVATNIAESSITVIGVKYIIDFCLSKEVRFNHKTRLENLEMIWTSQASSEQRAGRTGRVCNGYVFRLLQKNFFQKLPKYSTPQIQRCSLDRLILRIKLLHESEVAKESPTPVFFDPGMVLGRAIQPPSLKNIDASIKSLMFNGGLQLINQQFHLTDLGRIYIDLPVDIIYSRMLIVSMIFGTLDDIIILVTLLQQARNPFRQHGMQKRYLDYWQLVENEERCDFYGMVQIYKKKVEGVRIPEGVQSYNLHQIRTHKQDIEKRLAKLQMYKNRPSYVGDQKLRFKLTIWASFLDNAMRVLLPSHDEKEEKRIKSVARKSIPLDRTLVINSTLLKKHKLYENNENFIKEWKHRLQDHFRLKDDPENIVLDYSQSYIVFKNSLSLMKILFCKTTQQSFGSAEIVQVKAEENLQPFDNQKHFNFSVAPQTFTNYMSKILNDLGDIELLHRGEVMDMYSNRKVSIDAFSINRVISLNPAANVEYVVTNSKVERTSGSYCRYTCMLPNQLGLYQLLLLTFYPYLSIKADEKGHHYESIRLRKKAKINIGFALTNKDIQQINVVRKMLRRFLCLEGSFERNDVTEFWPKLKALIETERQPLIDQKKWKKLFFSQIKHQDPPQMTAQTRQLQLKYMSPIEPCQLRKGYFSYEHLSAQEYQQHMERYNQWKLKILKEISQMRDFIWNTETHISCSRCHAKVGRLRDVGGIINGERIFAPLHDALKEARFNEMDDQFCSLLSMNYELLDFKVQSCVNDHILAIKSGNPAQYRLTQFSGIEIVLPDESIEQVDFDKLDTRNYTNKTNKALNIKKSMDCSITCKICEESFNSIAEMDKHLKTWLHEEILKEFKMSIST